MNTLRKTLGPKAFTIVEMLVVIATIAVFSFLVMRSLARPRVHSTRIHCVNNLKNVGLAFRIFATDNQDKFPMAISTNHGGSLELADSPLGLYRTLAVLSNELSTPKLLRCPMDRTAQETTNFSSFALTSTNGLPFPPGMSYFLNQYADERRPFAVLAGDRNITNDWPSRHDIRKAESIQFTERSHPGWTADIHQNQGNAAMSDGSVQQINTASALRSVLIGNSTNRTVLHFPGVN